MANVSGGCRMRSLRVVNVNVVKSGAATQRWLLVLASGHPKGGTHCRVAESDKTPEARVNRLPYNGQAECVALQ